MVQASQQREVPESGQWRAEQHRGHAAYESFYARWGASTSGIASLRRGQPHFANARSIRNALDRMRLRLASRVFEGASVVTRDDLMTIREEDVRASPVYTGGFSGDGAEASKERV